MRPLTISFGRGDKAAITTVKSLSWEEFSTALTTEPPEVADKAARGWWIPACLDPVYRDSENFKYRDAITYDFDHPNIDSWGHVIHILADIPFAMYTTYNHTYDAPRFRVVVPLSRPTGYDEFMAVARKLGEKIGIELIARESFVAAQMCYLPARKLGGAFEGYVNA